MLPGFDAASLVGTTRTLTATWEPRDVMLHALAVGAGTDDLAHTTEHSEGQPLAVLPTFAMTVLFDNGALLLGDVDQTLVLHAEQTLDVPAPLPPSGTAEVTIEVTDALDKGAGAMVVERSTAVDPATGATLATATSTMFVKGAGGWGGERGTATMAAVPAREPDVAMTHTTRDDQALLYRLCGDRNPLHSDPAFAARAGFDRPILHGLCFLGITARLLGTTRGVSARFTSPVTPGETLTVQRWDEPDGTRFRTLAGAERRVVLDRGTAS